MRGSFVGSLVLAVFHVSVSRIMRPLLPRVGSFDVMVSLCPPSTDRAWSSVPVSRVQLPSSCRVMPLAAPLMSTVQTTGTRLCSALVIAAAAWVYWLAGAASPSASASPIASSSVRREAAVYSCIVSESVALAAATAWSRPAWSTARVALKSMRQFWPSTEPSALPLMLTTPLSAVGTSHVMGVDWPATVTVVSDGLLSASRGRSWDMIQVPSVSCRKDWPYAVISCPQLHDARTLIAGRVPSLGAVAVTIPSVRPNAG